MEVVDELGEQLNSEQRRLLSRGLQTVWDEDDASFIDDDSEASEEEVGNALRVRTVIHVARPPSLGYVMGPLLLQALLSSFAIFLR